MSTPIDDYLEMSEQFKMRIKETEDYIAWMKRRTGLARYKAKTKIREAQKMLIMLNQMSEDNCLPWEPGPTYKPEGLQRIASLH